MNRFYIITPLLIALSPVLFLWFQNIEKVVTDGLGLIIVSFVLASILLTLLVFLLSRQIDRSIVLSNILILLFFAHGHLMQIIIENSNYQNLYVLNLCLIFLYVILLFFTHKDIKKRVDVKPLLKFFFVFGIIMVCWPTFGIIKFYFLGVKTSERVMAIPESLQDLTAEKISPEGLPDIYFIVLDGYARKDVLASSFGYDNSEFIKSLAQRGFYISDKATCSYPNTHHSLPSTLNLDYLNEIEPPTRSEAFPLIHDNIAARYLKKKGYQYITINTNWGGTDRSTIADRQFRKPFSNEFLSILLNKSLAASIMPSTAERHLYSFSSFQEIVKLNGPKFTFAHLIFPHGPFVFDANGNEIAVQSKRIEDDPGEIGNRPSDRKPYIEQVKFANKKVIELIDALVNNSSIQPIIILQSDHGWHTVTRSASNPKYLFERFGILNAWLAPDSVKGRLSHNMNSVNTFRILFSDLFDADYSELENHSYVPTKDTYIDITDRLVR